MIQETGSPAPAVVRDENCISQKHISVHVPYFHV